MRPLKFRVWDRTNKYFKYVIFGNGGWDFGDSKFIQRDTEWMQFTGLLDKQGKEIYEGDIVKITCVCGHQENLPVEWRDGYNGYYARAKCQLDWDDEQLALKRPSCCEVVGNIYENPELLSKVIGNIYECPELLKE